jgi:hypothetical protein
MSRLDCCDVKIGQLPTASFRSKGFAVELTDELVVWIGWRRFEHRLILCRITELLDPGSRYGRSFKSRYRDPVLGLYHTQPSAI